MTSPAQPRLRNRMLAPLPDEEMAIIRPHLERFPLDVGQVVGDVYRPLDHVYFPETGVVSSLSVMTDGSAVETATIGYEGMFGLSAFYGVESTPEHAFIQVPGEGHRIPAPIFREILRTVPTLRERLNRYTVALLSLVGQNSGCNRKHAIDQRCARWLLMTHDRVGRDQFELTHLVLSQMLGVRRASVTVAAIALQNAGAIEYTRGKVTVVDRTALERSTCDCYAIIQSAFDRIVDGRAVASPLDNVRVSYAGRSTAGDGGPEPGVVSPAGTGAPAAAGATTPDATTPS